MMVAASSMLMTSVRSKNVPMAVTAPIVSKATCGKPCFACSLPNIDRNTFSCAAWNGTREPPSSPANTEANAVTMIRMVMTAAARWPQLCSTTIDATDLDWAISCHGATPSTLMLRMR